MNTTTRYDLTVAAVQHGWEVDYESPGYLALVRDGDEVSIGFHRGHGGITSATFRRAGRRHSFVSSGTMVTRREIVAGWLTGPGRTLGDLKRGDIVGDQIVLRNTGTPAGHDGDILVYTTGEGYPHLRGKPSDPAPAPGEASPRALAELYLTQAATDLDEARARLNALLPKIPAGLTADLDDGEELYCPKPGCTAHLTASAATTERSPVLGWGPAESYDYRDGKPTAEPVTALWVGDYEYGDESDPIDSITCWNGHAWRVPDHIDRNV